MRILCCCEQYAPSVGGVQEVIKQVAERLVLRGHDVTVATSKLSARHFTELNGVKIKEFRVFGNWVRGMTGEVDEYRRFVVEGTYDVIMIKAAQQWTFDAVWPVLPEITAAKVFVPCGFSRMFEPAFSDYFQRLPAVLRQFDRLVFYASDYRDINFAKRHGCTHYSIIPNGASEDEFSVQCDPQFRERHGIGTDDLVFLSVGSLCREKGHVDVVDAFAATNFGGGRATLILNCKAWEDEERLSPLSSAHRSYRNYIEVLRQVHAQSGFRQVAAHVAHGLLNKLGIRRGRYAAKELTYREEVMQAIEQIHRRDVSKRVLLVDLPRAELVQAFMNTDLFVLASHVEYSPLVLFEAAAAGTPFLSVPVGNAEEIARWTGAGVICPAAQDKRGYTVPDAKALAAHMSWLVQDRERLRQLGSVGHARWQERFSWNVISEQYEQMFLSMSPEACKVGS